MNHCSAATPDMLQHSSFLSCEKHVQCSVLPSLDQTFDSHQLPQVPSLCHFAAFTAKEGSQRAGKICSPFNVFPEGNQNIKQAILQDRGKKERKKKKRFESHCN